MTPIEPYEIPYGILCRYPGGDVVRPATREELTRSMDAARRDGGRGVMWLDGARHYVEGGELDLLDWVQMDNTVPAEALPEVPATRPAPRATWFTVGVLLGYAVCAWSLYARWATAGAWDEPCSRTLTPACWEAVTGGRR